MREAKPKADVEAEAKALKERLGAEGALDVALRIITELGLRLDYSTHALPYWLYEYEEERKEGQHVNKG